MTRLALCIGLAALAATGAAQPHNQDLLIGGAGLGAGLIVRMTPDCDSVMAGIVATFWKVDNRQGGIQAA